MIQFYFTCHPGDLSRTRLIRGADVMLVASSMWTGTRLRISRPPADHIGRLVIDSGGFTAAKKWGAYPWSPQQYIDWIREETRGVPCQWAASMDYACEREVNRQTYATNVERIRATIENEMALRQLAPDLPWLGVLQGNTLGERLFDIRCRRRLGLIHPLMGVGSICGRQAREAADVLRFYRRILPAVRFHGFGLDVRTLDAADDLHVVSWDSYAHNWPRGRKGKDRPAALQKDAAESYSSYTARVGAEYWSHTVQPRQRRARQRALEIA